MSMFAQERFGPGLPTALQRPVPMSQSSGLPPQGYEIHPVEELDDPYAKLDARDYKTVTFGRLLVEDYGHDLKDRLLSTGADFGDSSSRHDSHLLYSRNLALLPPTKAAKLGLEIDLIMGEADLQFCKDFLGFMKSLDYDPSESLPLGPTSPDFWTEGTGKLLGKLQPSGWRQLNWNDRCCEETGPKPLPSGYKRLIGKIVSEQIVADPLERLSAYPLLKLNPDTYLYLCEDSKLRVKVEGSLLPSPPPSFANGPAVNLAWDYEGTPKEACAKVTTHVMTKKGSDISFPFKQLVYPGRVLSKPVKQRLADMAGVALNYHVQPA